MDSCFLRIRMRERLPLAGEDEQRLISLIRCCFHMRRKTLANNLKSSFWISQEQATRILNRAEVSEKIRGEALSLAELNRVCDALFEILKER